MKGFIQKIIKKYNNDRTRLLDIFWDIQESKGYVSNEALVEISLILNISVIELQDTLSFYHFFHSKNSGRIQIYIDTSAISEIFEVSSVIQSFEKELKCKLGQVDPSGTIGLFTTSCIGMSDQAPAALINGVPVGLLTPKKVKKIVSNLKKGIFPEYNVKNKLQKKGPILTSKNHFAQSLYSLLMLTPEEIIKEVEDSGLRGRGGAGFSTGKKWRFCALQENKTRYVICNADEGEPGTFKDRYLITEKCDLLIEGMIICARAIGAKEGVIYLRSEYKYLKPHIEEVFIKFRKNKLLGKNILGIKDFSFDIRIQLGAGAYVVGEETALLESLEGKRGEPRLRPPFPVEEGYLSSPTVVNNVETLSSVSRIIEKGAQWFRKWGTDYSPGTKLLSVSGDCLYPGIYEVPWGISLKELTQLVGAIDPLLIQVGGPSGESVNFKMKDRQICFEDLPTGGSMMFFSKKRNLLQVIKNFVQFFVNESCGCCLPCRAGNILFNEQMDYILSGEAAKIDLKRIQEWAQFIGPSSRCGLGQTCVNPLLTSIQNFPDIYNQQVKEHEDLFRPFDVKEKKKHYKEAVFEYKK